MRYIFIILVTFLFGGCVQNISQQGLTIKVPAYKITESLQQQFPIQQKLKYGKVTLQNPKALLISGSDRVQAGTTIGFSAPFIPDQSGSLLVSGKPIFDAKSGAIYLTKPSIDKLEFNGYKLSSAIQEPLMEAIIPIINEVFKSRPIYRLNKNSIQSMFVNNIRVSNGELLVTFGL